MEVGFTGHTLRVQAGAGEGGSEDDTRCVACALDGGDWRRTQFEGRGRIQSEETVKGRCSGGTG